LGEGLLWAEPPIDFCNETTTYGHHPRGRSAPASKPRASRETNDPLAFAHASVRLPVSHLAMGPARPCRGQRAVKVRPRADSLPTASPRFPWNPPRYSHGPTVLKRRARSLLGVLRAPLLRRQPSIPSSPARCHGSLESSRRASRGPSRQVSLAERGRVRHHVLAEVFVPTPSREGRRFPEDQGAFHRSSPRLREGCPSVRAGRSLRHAARP
jgi:hypothetical protein